MTNVNLILKRHSGCDMHIDGIYSYCNDPINAVNLALNNDISQIDTKLLYKFIHSLFETTNDFCIGSICALSNKDKVINLLNNIFEKMPEFFEVNLYNIIGQILKYPWYDDCFNHLNNISKLNDNLLILDRFIKRLTSNYVCENDNLVNFVVKNTTITKKLIELLILCKNETMANHIANIIDKSDDTYDDEFTYKVLNILPYSKQIIYSLIAKGSKLTNEHFEFVLVNCSVESIEFITNLLDPVIKKQHFQQLVLSPTEKSIMKGRDDVIIWDNNVYRLDDDYSLYSYKYESNYSKEIMTILINHGFVPDKDDILLSVKNKIEIPMIQKFINLDKSFLKLCQENNFYPKYDFKCITTEMLELRALCVTKNLPKVRNFLKKHKIIPDSVCMEHASKLKNNDKTLSLLIGAGGIVTPKCFELYADTIGDPQLIMMANSLVLHYVK